MASSVCLSLKVVSPADSRRFPGQNESMPKKWPHSVLCMVSIILYLRFSYLMETYASLVLYIYEYLSASHVPMPVRNLMAVEDRWSGIMFVE